MGIAILCLLCGGRAMRARGALEVTLSRRRHGRVPYRVLPFRAITFGHVIIAIGQEDMERSRAHEQAHVRQYERWGILFFLAYPASSVWQLLRGRKAYRDNCFEVQARRLGAARQQAKHDA